jgi:EAL domain-containing protein (putative c-di-GMP-specific phosphodiesterase class I)/ActR/RegA family two-component response regulator
MTTDRQARVLVLDDDAFMLSLLGQMLARLDYKDVTTFTRGADAVDALKRDTETFDLILCDLQMPEMDGVEFVRHLVDSRYTGALVLVSGEDSRILEAAENLAKAHSLQVLGTLRKPPSPSALATVLARLGPRATATTGTYAVQYSRSDLQQALLAGQFIAHYQPKINITTGALTGVECLVRWQNLREGLCLPGRFLPSIEVHGLMDALTEVVITTAMKDAQRWRHDGLDISVAVNVSMSSLTNLAFPEFIADTGHALEMPLNRLILEVTETQLMQNVVAAYEILTRLRLKRVGLAIDDFGVGHSSLAKLRDLPFNELKVDRGFVHGAYRNESLAVFLKASIGLARQLGISTVAEGVEDQDDWTFLRATACEQVQGWFIAKAMPAGELGAWALSWDDRFRALSGSSS